MMRLPWILGLGVGLMPVTAWAGNGSRPRVPPSFLDGQCFVDIDRSAAGALHVPIGIPFEDLDRTEDEPVDGRTFQFFAACRAVEPLEALPAWIDEEDAMRAMQADPSIAAPGPDEVLAGSPWDGCMVAVTPEADRMPIGCEATADGLRWDGSGVEPGSYVLWGYTFEPPQNLWTSRPGVVRVHDGDPDALGPAVAWSFPVERVDATLQGGIRLEGCAVGSPGARLEVAWARAAALETDDPWVAFAEVEIIDGVVAVEFVPPVELRFEAVYFRARATDLQGRTAVAYTRAPVVFLDGCDDPRGGTSALVDQCGVVDAAGSEPGAAAVACDGDDEASPPDETGGELPPEPVPKGDGADADTSSADASEETSAEGGCRLAEPGSGPGARGLWVVLLTGGRRFRRGRRAAP